MINEEYSKLTNLIDFSQLKDKSILITGASGLIGINLLSCLKQLQKSFNIKIYAWIKNDIDSLFEDFFKNCEIIKHDITDQSFYVNLPNFDYIIHAAGYGQPIKFTSDKLKTIVINTTVTINLLNKLNKNGKFLFISTSEVYSGNDSENLTEDDIGNTNTNHIRSCYIDSKKCGESICYSFMENKVDVKIVRLSLAYGPGTKENDTRVLNQLIQKALTCKEIKLADKGDAIRTYCYITDVIEMIWNILFFGKHKVYNVGGISKISILNLANEIGNFLGKNVIIPDISNELTGSPKVVNISLNRYINEFNKNEFVSLKEGLSQTIEWQKKIYNSN